MSEKRNYDLVCNKKIRTFAATEDKGQREDDPRT